MNPNADVAMFWISMTVFGLLVLASILYCIKEAKNAPNGKETKRGFERTE